MRALEDGNAAEAIELRGVGLVVERAGNQHVETGVARLARRGHEVGAGHRAELLADEDPGAPLRPRLSPAVDVAALGADVRTGPRRDRGEGDAVLLVCLLDARRRELFQNHAREVLLRAVGGLRLRHTVQEARRSRRRPPSDAATGSRP